MLYVTLTFNYENIAFVANCVKNNSVSFIRLIRHNRAVSVPNSVQIRWNENRMRDFCPNHNFINVWANSCRPWLNQVANKVSGTRIQYIASAYTIQETNVQHKPIYGISPVSTQGQVTPWQSLAVIPELKHAPSF